MKIRFYVSSLLVVVVLLSCSVENQGLGTASPKEPAADFFPLKRNNQWVFKNEIEGDHSGSFFETLVVKDSLTENETLGYLLDSDQANKNQGLMTAMLSNGRMNNVEGRLFFNGDLQLTMPVLDSIRIPLRNLLLLNQNSEEEKELISNKGSFKSLVTLDSTLVSATIDYKIRTVLVDKLTSYSVRKKNYEKVISILVILELKATADLPGNFKVDLLSQQEVLQSINYFAEEIGLIYSETVMEGEYEDLSEYGIPRSTEFKRLIVQSLEDYSLK